MRALFIGGPKGGEVIEVRDSFDQGDVLRVPTTTDLGPVVIEGTEQQVTFARTVDYVFQPFLLGRTVFALLVDPDVKALTYRGNEAAFNKLVLAHLISDKAKQVVC